VNGEPFGNVGGRDKGPREVFSLTRGYIFVVCVWVDYVHIQVTF
jgi:hypothetical protein